MKDECCSGSKECCSGSKDETSSENKSCETKATCKPCKKAVCPPCILIWGIALVVLLVSYL